MSNLKKVLALVLAMAMCLTMFAGAIETNLPIDDAAELTAEQYDALQLLYALGVVKGDNDGNVNGVDTLTRGEMAVVLYRLYEADKDETYVSTFGTESNFDDVAADKYYTPYVNWAYIKGVIAGYGNGNFGPEDYVTGEQVATMLARLLGYEVAGNNWQMIARKYAIDLGLDDGVASKDLFGTEITRGDLFVMLANTLNSKEVGSDETLAEAIFDLEIIEDAVLVETKKLGSTPYSLFAFKGYTFGDVQWFFARFLSIEEEPTVDEIGQKYTLYVAKTEDSNGYRELYAAYEQERGGDNLYYDVAEGVVDDGLLKAADAVVGNGTFDELLDDDVVLYIDGVVEAKNAVDAYAKFWAAYNLRNGAKYKLIDVDGDKKYEFIFIEKLTLAEMALEEVVANVVSFDSNTRAYTLSNGKTYLAGHYWATNAAGAPTEAVFAYDAIQDCVGEFSWAPSSVQYKFTIEGGKYIMKAEVCDETYFAGDYVLSMGLVGTSTYKGMQYVEFLTEDNTTLYAYVESINHVDARTWTNDGNFWWPVLNPAGLTLWNGLEQSFPGADNNWSIAWSNRPCLHDWYDEQLFYVNAYGDDTVQLFTANYMNSAYVNDHKDEAGELVNWFSADITKYVAVSDMEESAINVTIPTAFDATKQYLIRHKIEYHIGQRGGYWWTSVDNFFNGQVQHAEKAPSYTEGGFVGANDDINFLQIAVTNLGLTQNYLIYVAGATPGTYVPVNNRMPLNVRTDYYLFEYVDVDADTFAGWPEEIRAKAYCVDKPAHDGVTKSIVVEYAPLEMTDFQIFKLYGTWYAQSYASENVEFNQGSFKDGVLTGANYRVLLNNNWVVWDGTRYIHADGEKVGQPISTGTTKATTIKAAVEAFLDDYADNDKFGSNGTAWDTAIALETSKGVVFAYGVIPFLSSGTIGENSVNDVNRFQWKAYNYDEFTTDFGHGGLNDDRDALIQDEMIFATSAGKVYVKAMKVTVGECDPDQDGNLCTHNFLPYGWMDGAENYVVFIVDQALAGAITSTYRTVGAMLPNGGKDTFKVPYGTYFNRGDIVYAVLAEDGETIVSFEVIADFINLFTVTRTALSIAADGTLSITGNWGLINKTQKIDVTKTFFLLDGVNVTAAQFIAGAKGNITVSTGVNGYFCVEGSK